MNKEVWSNPKQEKSLDEAQSPLWFWNDKLEKEELLRQLEMKTEIGVTCTNPHARTNKGEGYIGGYLDDQWFENIKTVLDYKGAHGEKMWIYDEIDWPAGTQFRTQLLTFEGAGLFEVTQETDKSDFCYNVNIIDDETGDAFEIARYMIYDMFEPELEFSSDKDCTAFITKIHVDAL